MGKVDQKKVRARLERYLADYDLSDPGIEKERDHICRVARFCRRIAASVNLSPEDCDLAWLIGMLHDIGRFEQFRRYHTLQDYKSINHAALGADLLFHDWLIREFYPTGSMEDYQLINKAIRLHNVYALPANLTGREKLFCDILRDSDKIDILRMECETPGTEMYDLPEEDYLSTDISDAVYEDVKAQKHVKRVHLKTAPDYRVGLISLVFDLVFPESFRIVQEQGFLGHLLDYDSDNPVTRGRMEQIRQIVHHYTEVHSRTDAASEEDAEEGGPGRDTVSWQQQSLETATEVIDTCAGGSSAATQTPAQGEGADEPAGEASDTVKTESPASQPAEPVPEASGLQTADPAEKTSDAKPGENRPKASDGQPAEEPAKASQGQPGEGAAAAQAAESAEGKQESVPAEKAEGVTEGPDAKSGEEEAAAPPEEGRTVPASDEAAAAPAAQPGVNDGKTPEASFFAGQAADPASPSAGDREKAQAVQSGEEETTGKAAASSTQPAEGGGKAPSDQTPAEKPARRKGRAGVIVTCIVIGACAAALIWTAVSLNRTVNGGGSGIQSATDASVSGEGDADSRYAVSIENAAPGQTAPIQTESVLTQEAQTEQTTEA